MENYIMKFVLPRLLLLSRMSMANVALETVMSFNGNMLSNMKHIK